MIDPSHPLTELLRRDKRYHAEAYVFVFEGLRFAQEHHGLVKARTQESDDNVEEDRHVSGQQLCEAIRRYAVEQYGLLAQCVLNTWGVRDTSDFGEIVFNLIDIGQMRKTDSDRREDFEEVFNFDEAFRQGFKIVKPRPSKEPRS
ncbi:MAG: Minf_1886 family protein [Pirellulales bacterium]